MSSPSSSSSLSRECLPLNLEPGPLTASQLYFKSRRKIKITQLLYQVNWNDIKILKKIKIYWLLLFHQLVLENKQNRHTQSSVLLMVSSKEKKRIKRLYHFIKSAKAHEKLSQLMLLLLWSNLILRPPSIVLTRVMVICLYNASVFLGWLWTINDWDINLCSPHGSGQIIPCQTAITLWSVYAFLWNCQHQVLLAAFKITVCFIHFKNKSLQSIQTGLKSTCELEKD